MGCKLTDAKEQEGKILEKNFLATNSKLKREVEEIMEREYGSSERNQLENLISNINTKVQS